MSLSVHEIKAEILTLPVQEQQKVIDFAIQDSHAGGREPVSSESCA